MRGYVRTQCVLSPICPHPAVWGQGHGQLETTFKWFRGCWWGVSPPLHSTATQPRFCVCWRLHCCLSLPLYQHWPLLIEPSQQALRDPLPSPLPALPCSKTSVTFYLLNKPRSPFCWVITQLQYRGLPHRPGQSPRERCLEQLGLGGGPFFPLAC